MASLLKASLISGRFRKESKGMDNSMTRQIPWATIIYHHTVSLLDSSFSIRDSVNLDGCYPDSRKRVIQLCPALYRSNKKQKGPVS